MSIVPFIQTHEQRGDLRRVIPSKGVAARRGLWLGPLAQTAMDDPNSALNLLGAKGACQALFERWVEGRPMALRMSGHKPGAFLARLDPPTSETWEFRITEPINQFRAICRFAAPDMAIVTNVVSKRLLGGKKSAEWNRAQKICTDEWDRMFPSVPPHSGETVYDYVTENVREIVGAKRAR